MEDEENNKKKKDARKHELNRNKLHNIACK